MIFMNRNQSNNHENLGNHGQKNAHFEIANKF